MIKTETKKVISVQDWNNLVEKTYNKIYNFQQQDGCKFRQRITISVPEEGTQDFENTELPYVVNGGEMGVAFEIWLNTNPKDTERYFDYEFENKLFWERNFYPSIDMIINDLHQKGLLEEGEYEIDIDW